MSTTAAAPQQPPRLFWQVALMMTGLLIAFSVLIGTIGISYFSHALRDQAIKRGRAIATTLASSLSEVVAARQDAAVAQSLREIKRESVLRYIEILEPDGRIYVHSWEEDKPPQRNRGPRDPGTTLDEEVQGHPVIDVPAQMNTGHIVHVGVNAATLQAHINLARLAVIGVTLIEVLVALLAAVVVVRPYVRNLAQANQQLSENLGQLENTQEQLSAELRARKVVEEELRRTGEVAESANRAKSTFLATMSHEIRTPMNGILGMTELALGTPLTREQREYLQAVKSSGDNLLTLINDILDLSKIEAGKLDLDPVDFSLRDRLLEAMRPLASRAHASGLELAVDVHPDVPDWVHGDPLRLRQVIVNLVGNAIKFTEEGEVVLKVEARGKRQEASQEEARGEKQEARAEGTASSSSASSSDLPLASCLLPRPNLPLELHFEVRDTGIGIPRDKHESLFQAFTQADGSTTRRYGGTGLGLTISNRLVQMMGGEIEIESEPGRGSTFHFTLSLMPGKGVRPKVSALEATTLRNLPLLIVDDNATNRRILEEMTRGWGMRPTLVSSGAAALEALEAATARQEPFVVVLLDGMMPDMDGPMTAREIQRRPHLGGVRVILLTSADRLMDDARCDELGLTDYLVKPIHSSDLQVALVTALSRARLTDPGPREGLFPENSAARPLRILLAEDNSINQMLAVTLLKKEGHSVEVARDGREALTALERSSFDVVLMDVQMPNMDGFEATARIREKEKRTGEHLPIVALTANAMKGDREECLAKGMDDYLGKPIQVKELLEVLARTVRQIVS